MSNSTALRKALMEAVATAFISAPDYATARAAADLVLCSKAYDQLQPVDKCFVNAYVIGYEDALAYCRGWKVVG